MKIPFDNTYINLPEEFYSRTNPTPVTKPKLIEFNQSLALEMGIEGDVDEASLEMFSGNGVPEGAEPLAMAYAGHQFGGFSHQLGDGRAILLGEVLSSDGKRFDIQLKGSGPTPWSRSGDGRSALGPVIREYLLSEAMAKLSVPTTRALAAVTTGEQVARNTLVPGGILTRVASGFVRVGTFEYFSARDDQEAIKQLADYEIERHYPQAKNAENPYAAFLAAVVEGQAKLVAQWMGLGFIHGVMNTDNMSIACETIDYGPCAFMDQFEFGRVYSSIDRKGRYAYNNQPSIAQWNLIRLAETLLPLLSSVSGKDEQGLEIAQEVLNNYAGLYQQHWLEGMRKKLGLEQAVNNEKSGDESGKENDDEKLIISLLDIMEKNQADFTLVFLNLSKLSIESSEQDKLFSALFANENDANQWLAQWRDRLSKQSLDDTQRQTQMRLVNPVYIPRNHQVEKAIRAAEDHDDFSVFHDLHDVLQKPYETQLGKDSYMLPPKPEEVVQQTFCGT